MSQRKKFVQVYLARDQEGKNVAMRQSAILVRAIGYGKSRA